MGSESIVYGTGRLGKPPQAASLPYELRMVRAMLSFLPLFLLLAANAPADDLTQETAQVESRLSALTGLAFKHPVPHEVITRDQLRKYLESVVKKTLKPEDVHNSGNERRQALVHVAHAPLR